VERDKEHRRIELNLKDYDALLEVVGIFESFARAEGMNVNDCLAVVAARANDAVTATAV